MAALGPTTLWENSTVAKMVVAYRLSPSTAVWEDAALGGQLLVGQNYQFQFFYVLE